MGSQPRSPLQIEPFSIRIEDEVLSDLRVRIRKTRWPDQVPGVAWEQGTELQYLKQLLAYWADGFDWRAQERKLNAFDQFRAELGGVPIRFVHERARRGRGIPLILRHTMLTYFEVESRCRFERHSHESEQITMVLEGVLYFETDAGVTAVGPGEVFAVPSHVPHAVFTQDDPARAVDAWAPVRPDYDR